MKETTVTTPEPVAEAKKPGTPNPGTPADGRLKANKGKKAGKKK